MNQTEAWEEVVSAAESMVAQCDAGRTVGEPDCIKRLRKAITKIKPRVERMRSRLDHLRARKAGKPRCPKGLEP